MADLFDFASATLENPGRSAENPGVSIPDFSGPYSPCPEVRTRTSPGMNPGEVRSKDYRGRREAKAAARIPLLRQMVLALQSDLGIIDQQLYDLKPSYERLKGNFDSAHVALDRLCAQTWDDRSDSAKAVRRQAYEARRLAGHAWHPVRQPYQALESWRKAVTAELSAINAELSP